MKEEAGRTVPSSLASQETEHSAPHSDLRSSEPESVFIRAFGPALEYQTEGSQITLPLFDFSFFPRAFYSAS